MIYLMFGVVLTFVGNPFPTSEVHKKKSISCIGVRAICFTCVAIFRTRSREENVAAVNQSSRCADAARAFRLT